MKWCPVRVPIAVVLVVICGVLHGGLALAIEATPGVTPSPPRTLGELVDRVAVTWAGVRSYRSVTTIGAVAPNDASAPVGSPVAGVAGGIGIMVEIEDAVVLPDRKRRVSRSGGIVALEFVAVDGRVYRRDGGESGAWTEIDRAALDPTSQIGVLVADLATPVAAPFAGYPALARALPLVPLGAVTVAGRECVAYRVAIPNLGEAVETTLAIGADDLPCGSETRARGITTVVSYLAFNEALVIEAPAVATPVVAARSLELAGEACIAPASRRSSCR